MIRRLAIHLLFKLLLAALMAGTWLDQRLRPKMPFPRDPDALRADPDWCTTRLKAAGAIPKNAEITGFEVVKFKTNEAFRSLVATVDVRFVVPTAGPAADSGAEPEEQTRHFVAKFAPQVTSLRDHAIYLLQENAAKEAGVYRELSADPAVATPRAWITELHPLTGNLCIIMDRLMGCVEVTERAGCPADKCALAMAGFAALHARYWQRPDEATFLQVVPDPVIDYLASRFEGDDAALFGELIRATWRYDSLPPTTVLHGDARVGNMLFGGTATGEAGRDTAGDTTEDATAHGLPPAGFAFIDWQAARRGKGVFDVAYFLTLSVDAEVRRAEETALLKRYHAGLIAGGVTGYDWPQLWDDYRLAQLLTLAFVTLPFMSAESSTTDLNTTGIAELGEVWTRRMIAVVDDLDLPWLAQRTGTDASALRAAFARSNARAWQTLGEAPPA